MGLGEVGTANMDHRKGVVHRRLLSQGVASGGAPVMRSQNLKGWEKSIPDGGRKCQAAEAGTERSGVG